jgi:hypothetical protein
VGALEAVFGAASAQRPVTVKIGARGRRRVVGARAVTNAASGAAVKFVHSSHGPITLRLHGSLANFAQHGQSKLLPAILSYRTMRGTEVVLG